MTQGNFARTRKEMLLARRLEQVRAADARGDVEEGIKARMNYIEVAEFSGRYDEALVNFTWCVGVCDRDEGLREKYRFKLLWRFKWILNSLVKYPEVTLGQIEHTFGEMARWYDRAGISHRPIHSLRMQAVRHTGQIEQLEPQRALWQQSAMDDYKDCDACEANSLMESYTWEGNWRKALDVSEGLVEGFSQCAEQPQSAHMILLVPLFRLGELDLARDLVRQSQAKIVGNRECMAVMGELATFLTATDALGTALEVVECILRDLPEVRRGWDRMWSLMGVRIFLLRLGAAGRKTVPMRLLPGHPLKTENDTYEVAGLLAWAEGEIGRIAAAFDARNGNGYVSGLTRGNDDLVGK